MAEEKKVITINDVDYTEDQLTDQQKVMINHINSLQQKINSAQFNMDQLMVGKERLSKCWQMLWKRQRKTTLSSLVNITQLASYMLAFCIFGTMCYIGLNSVCERRQWL
jgi:hypothetical protein